MYAATWKLQKELGKWPALRVEDSLVHLEWTSIVEQTTYKKYNAVFINSRLKRALALFIKRPQMFKVVTENAA